MTTATEATDPDDTVYDAEIVDDDDRLLPGAPADAPARYRITRHTILAEGELPPRVDEGPAFTRKDFTVPPSVKKRTPSAAPATPGSTATPRAPASNMAGIEIDETTADALQARQGCRWTPTSHRWPRRSGASALTGSSPPTGPRAC
jgi:hypothetical protein